MLAAGLESAETCLLGWGLDGTSLLALQLPILTRVPLLQLSSMEARKEAGVGGSCLSVRPGVGAVPGLPR